MVWLAWILLAAALGGAVYIHYIIHRDLQGPSHCIGCGKCSKDGVCILTGKPVGSRRRDPEK